MAMWWIFVESRLFVQELVIVSWDRFVYFCFRLWYGKKFKAVLPAVDNPLLLESATSLAAKIRAGKVKSADVVKAYIERIKKVQPVLNALVDERFEAAIQEAEEIDDMVSGGLGDPDRLAKPLLGIPFTTKNYVGVRGCLQDTGSWYFRGHRAEEDATAVKLLREAGAIPLAISNVPELCSSYDCNNTLYGCTNNPYDVNRIPGGSSGGEAAWLASASSLIGVGTDVGGSLRCPAAYCGVFCHKPTAGVVPLDGLYPEMNEELSNFNTIGPMVRYVDDLLPVFKILAGARDTARLRLDVPVDLKNVKLFHMSDDGARYFSRMSAEMSMAVFKATAHLESISGSKSQLVSLPDITLGPRFWLRYQIEASDPPLAMCFKNGEGALHPVRELSLAAIGRSRHVLPSIFTVFKWQCCGSGGKTLLEDYASKAKSFGDKIQQLLGDDGVLIFPSDFGPAPYRHQWMTRMNDMTMFLIPFNVIGVPVSSVPIMISENENLPVGVQVVGGRGNDRLCLAVAKVLGNAFGGWKLPAVRAEA